MASETTQAILNVAASVRPQLKALGYRKHRLTFRRVVADGFEHVIDFQPGRSHLYGKFTVNLGLYLRQAEPDVEQFPESARAAYRPGDYPQLSRRLGLLLPDARDTWWTLDEPLQPTTSAVSEALRDFGFPWLDQLGDIDAVLAVLENSALPSHEFGAPVRLIAMRIRLARGERHQAERDFADHVAFESQRGVPSGHSEYLGRIAAAEEFSVAVPFTA